MVQAIECLQGGLAEVDMLVAAIDSTRAELEHVREDFRATVSAEGPVAGPVLVHEVTAVEQSLRDYFELVDSIAGYLQGFDAQYLEKAVDHLGQAEDRLNLDFLRFREAALRQRGPTTHAGLNHLYALATNGGGPLLDAQKQVEEARAHAALSTLESDPNMEVLAQPLQEFYEEYLDLLASPAPEAAWLEQLLACGKRYAQLDVDFLNRLYGGGPTPLPFLNLVIHSAWLLTQGAVVPEVVLFFLQQAEQALQTAAEVQHQMTLGLSAGAPESEAIQVASASLQQLGDGLAAYWPWLEAPEPARLEELARPLFEHAATVRAAFDQLSSMDGQAESCSCSICGLSMPAGSSRCRGCGAALTLPAPSALAASNSMGAVRFHALLEAARAVLEEHEEVEALLELLQDMDNGLQLARKAENPAAPPDSAAAQYSRGLLKVGQAVEQLRRFADQPDRELLRSAGDLLGSAADLLQSAQRELASS